VCIGLGDVILRGFLSSLILQRPLYQVRLEVSRLVGSGSPPLAVAASNWTASDLLGLGWLLASLDADTLAKIPPHSMDGVRNHAKFLQFLAELFLLQYHRLVLNFLMT
jgi:hypothetical protein